MMEDKVSQMTMTSDKGAGKSLHLTPQQFLLAFILIAASCSLFFFGPPTVPNFKPKPLFISAVKKFQDAISVKNSSNSTKALITTGKSAIM